MEHDTQIEDEVSGKETDPSRPITPEVVSLLKRVSRAAQRGSIVGVAIGSVLDTLQVDGCSRSRNDVVAHNLLKSATHLASLSGGADCVESPLFSRDVWDPPIADVVSLVRSRLEYTEAGHVRGVVVAMVGSNNDIDCVSVGDGTSLVSNLLVAVRAELAHSVMHAMSIVPEGPRMVPVMPEEQQRRM